jgi:hypothetical protein
MQGKAHQLSLLFNKTLFCIHPAQVKFKQLLFYTLHIILKEQHHDKYLDYNNELLADHLGLWAPQMTVLSVQLNIFHYFLSSWCEIQPQLHESLLHTGEQNGNLSGSKSPHMFKKMCEQLEPLRRIAASTPTPTPLALF